MRINQDLCIGCGNCSIVCPMQAINIKENKAEVDKDLCVECSICYRNADCPVNAIKSSRLKWPRTIRNVFSDVISTHKLTGVPGRGTEEMKTNDLTNRFGVDEIGVSIEIGRPGLGTRLKNINYFTSELTKLGVEYEKSSPVTSLLTKDFSKVNKDVQDERVLSAIIEFKIPYEKLNLILLKIKEIEKYIDTVFTVGIISKVSDDGRISVLDTLTRKGYNVNPNAKVNIGLGKI